MNPIVTVALAAGIAATARARASIDRSPRAARLFRVLGGVELGLLIGLLALLVVLGCVQIFLRNAFHSGLLWADPMMRHAVLWIGCLGGALATSRLRHINIDVFSRALPDRLKPLRRLVVYVATAAATYMLGVAALGLVIQEREFGETAFLGVSVWLLQAAIPLSFFVMSYRSLVNLFLSREPRIADEFDEGRNEGLA